MTTNQDDLTTPEEMTVSSIRALLDALKETGIDGYFAEGIIIAATPEIINHYLEGR